MVIESLHPLMVFPCPTFWPRFLIINDSCFAAGLAINSFGLFDLFDGRSCQNPGKGLLLFPDSVVDRYSDLFPSHVPLLIHYLKEGRNRIWFTSRLLLQVLEGSSLYARAKSRKPLKISCNTGLMERPNGINPLSSGVLMPSG